MTQHADLPGRGGFPSQGRRRRGTSLVELLVALGLLALTVTIAFEVLGTSHRAHGVAEGRTAAAFLARSVLDQARATDFAALAGSTGTTTVAGVRNGQPVSWQFQHALNVETASLNTRRVWVTVTWREGRTPASVTLETVLSRR